MKLLLMADLHITDKTPGFRIDSDYSTVQYSKVEWSVMLAIKEKCSAILIAGDIFDRPTISISLLMRYVNLFEIDKCPFILTVFGQHDQKYRRKENTFLSLLSEIGIVQVLKPDEFFPLSENVNVYGAGVGEEILKPENKDAFNVLVTHRMVIQGKLWPGQTDYYTTTQLLRIHGDYDLIVSGDNHKTFFEHRKSSTLVNPGSIMRRSVDQRDHKPSVFIYNTKDFVLKKFEVPIEPIDEVMDLERADHIKETNEQLEIFVERLSQQYDIGVDFIDNLMAAMDSVTPEIREIVNDCLTKVKGGEV